MTSPYFNEPDPAPQQCPAHSALLPAPAAVTVCCEDRWQVYHRLQELGIDCECKGFQPLTVTIQTPTDAIQLWSVVRRVCQPRTDLATALTQSWKLPHVR